MTDWLDRPGFERGWAATVLFIVVGLIVGSLLAPRTVYDGFLWRYFWGPVDADAHGASCAVRTPGSGIFDGSVERLDASVECQTAAGIVAEPGYTTVSTITYALVLLLALIGILFLLRRLDIGYEREFFYALVPFMVFGGALRTVEDVNVAFLREGGVLIPYPWSGIIISPLIYFTVFFIVLAVLLVSVWAQRRRLVARYVRLMGAVGIAVLGITVGGLLWLSNTAPMLSFHPTVPAVVLGGATAITGVVWVVTQRFAPAINEGTGPIGAFIVWGHAVDGIANVFSLDWGHVVGLPGYTPKHVVNAAIIDVTSALQPAWLTASIGSAWPFLLVKVAVALFVVWIFDEQLFDEQPRYAILLLIAIMAVGTGPGTRDMLRATLAI